MTQARSMLPRAHFVARNSPGKSANTSLTTLQLLKEGLGQDAHLLDNIPLEAVKMVQTPELDRWLPYKMHVGTVNIDGMVYDAWAFVSSKLCRERDSTPRLSIFSATKQGLSKKIPIEQMSDARAGRWAVVFEKLKSADCRTILIMTCFILKGVQLPDSTRFTETFITDLKAICRSFAVECHKLEKIDTATITSNGYYFRPMVARKTQSQGPRMQLSRLVTASPSQDDETAPQSSNRTLAAPKVPSKATLEGLRERSALAHSTLPLVTVEHVNETTSFDAQLTTEPRHRARTSISPARLDSDHSSRQRHDPSFKADKLSRHHIECRSGRSLSASARNGLDELDDVQKRLVDIDEKLAKLDSDELESRNQYREFKRSTIRGIDVEMKQRHEAELKTLSERHKAEALMARNRFVLMQHKHTEDLQQFQKQRDKMLRQQKSVKEDLRRTREGWRPDQMRGFLNEDFQEQAQKRRKVFHSSNTGDAD